VTDDGPADPFKLPEGPDLNQIAAANFSFFAAHLAAGFTEGQALHLTTTWLTMMVAAASQQPGQADPGARDAP
jgi:hypothetical protein